VALLARERAGLRVQRFRIEGDEPGEALDVFRGFLSTGGALEADVDMHPGAVIDARSDRSEELDELDQMADTGLAFEDGRDEFSADVPGFLNARWRSRLRLSSGRR
jgi:hypothetical protein